MHPGSESKLLRACFFMTCLIFIPLAGAGMAGEKYPSRTIKFIVPFAAGGGVDVICRKLVNLTEKNLGQEIIIDNRGGGGGLVGMSFLAKSKPDGYTIGIIGSSMFSVYPHFSKIDFDPLDAFTPIVYFADMPQNLAVPADSKIKAFRDFLEEGRKRQITASTVGGLATGHIAMQRLGSTAKLNLKLVPFTGGAPAILAALGGQVDAYAGGGSYEYVKSGQLRIIARLFGAAKGVTKDVPSLKELGYDIEAVTSIGVAGPKGLPDPVQRRLEEAFTRSLQDPSLREVVETAGELLVYKNSKELGNHIREEFERGKREAQQLGLGIYSKEKK